MLIEWLKFKVAPERREEFIDNDAEIWTPVIASSPGFLGKEVWINPTEPTEVIMVIRWATCEQWKSFPQELLDRTEEKFAQAMGKSYQMLESLEYQVRKFPSTHP
ncbi:TIGR03792 family protein [Planktothrix sp. FACHB-1355]|uniref:TIGR03792 family protein n=1 Tax=Aerosakkonema funiforme FACHB-1375 TaxID=2949571 RepID=A0A926ZFB7_9CYAN|nr:MULTISPECIES: TIGR03792 family protein [Oscillatoriales]MBD2180680.1 TIGR03792 family protein [Aerosakkonema funiforme FACHB-1375]MBD3561468.1 TIGR03792 family protein [Planktothrix sp. FACHB-1355]